MQNYLKLLYEIYVAKDTIFYCFYCFSFKVLGIILAHGSFLKLKGIS